MSLAVITVNAQSPQLDKQAQEVAVIARALELAATDIRSHGGAKTSGNINGDGGILLGTWVYTAQAAN
jgi:hypothetical protein